MKVIPRMSKTVALEKSQKNCALRLKVEHIGHDLLDPLFHITGSL